jgi:hypothetical protein
MVGGDGLGGGERVESNASCAPSACSFTAPQVRFCRNTGSRSDAKVCNITVGTVEAISGERCLPAGRRHGGRATRLPQYLSDCPGRVGHQICLKPLGCARDAAESVIAVTSTCKRRSVAQRSFRNEAHVVLAQVYGGAGKKRQGTEADGADVVEL